MVPIAMHSWTTPVNPAGVRAAASHPSKAVMASLRNLAISPLRRHSQRVRSLVENEWA